ncbi:MAG: hypothetical protein LQ343_004899 [Gyalolechia ehrenbergii]|nr:MAG: hypothetical protein LQ343_004899 [Gyalolechia ehrenbergii]
MPQLQNVIVCVTDGDGKGLEEWGVQYLRGNKVSAYIKSTPNMAFGISIRPRIPYPEEQPPDEGGRRGIKKEVLSDVKNKREDLDGDINMLPPYSAQRAPGMTITEMPFSILLEDIDADEHAAHRDFPCTRKPSRNDSFYRASSPIHKRKKTLQENIPPFSLLATLYLDGRIKSERALIVHLDPNDDDFSHPNGEATFRCRRVQGGNGFVNEQAWLFKEIGIETVFEKIVLRDPTDDLQDPEDVLVNALKDSGLGGERSQVKEERAKVGQIVIELKRVLLGKKFNNRDYRPMHSEGDKDDVEMDGASQEQLQKFNFLGFPRDLEIEKKRLRDARRLGTRLAMTTPLSIAHPLPPALKSGKRSKPTFEERVKEGSAELVDSEHKYEFKDYRDVDKSGKISSIVKSSKNPDNLQASHPAARGTSMVVAVKGKTRRLSKAKSSTRAGRFSSRSPSSNESTDNYPNSPHGSSIQPPANSPTTGFYDPIRDPRLSAPRGSQLDTFKTLCDTSLALIKATEPAGESQFESSSAVKDTKYRQLQYDSDSNDAGDEQSDAIEDEDDGDSDKENMQMTDADNAGLHNELKAISLGTKRQRGEGMEELEEGEVSETEEVQMKKKIPAADHAITGSVALERVIEEGKKKAALRAENGEEDAHFEKTLALWKEQEEQVGWGDLDDFL